MARLENAPRVGAASPTKAPVHLESPYIFNRSRTRRKNGRQYERKLGPHADPETMHEFQESLKKYRRSRRALR